MIEVATKDEHLALKRVVDSLEKKVLVLESVPGDPEFFTVEQVRELIGGRAGGKICRRKVMDLIKAGHLIKKEDSLGIRIYATSVRKYNLKHTIK